MKNSLIKIALILFLITGQMSFGQSTNQEKAYALGMEAIALMDRGEYDKSIKLLKEAKKLDPTNINYPYEIAYAYILKKDYKAAIKITKPLLKHKDVYDLVYQLLGNAYSMNGQPDMAIETYEKGLEIFPNSGKLYLERGNLERFTQNFAKAMVFYEKGIKVEPTFPSNYYWATKFYCNSTEEVWGMIYGEIFMNLERNSKRTSEISKLLFETYKSEIEFKNDSTYSVSFSKNNKIVITDLTDFSNLKLPFGITVYEPILILSILSVKTIDLSSLNEIRSRFIDFYFEKKHNETYPNILFDYQNKVKDAGHFEAYNYWILMKGDQNEFNKWLDENQEKWDDFTKWFTNNKLIINNTNKFHSGQF